VMCQLATDTPVLGSDIQDIHRDTPALFPEWKETPMFQLAVNFPLVDVTLQNGPIEIAKRTYNIPKEEGFKMMETGETVMEPIPMTLGDVMIRDVRGLHRGTSNMTDQPRPMVVIGYSRKWLFRPEVDIKIPESTWKTLSPRAKHMLRYNPKVPDTTEIKEEYEIDQVSKSISCLVILQLFQCIFGFIELITDVKVSLHSVNGDVLYIAFFGNVIKYLL